MVMDSSIKQFNALDELIKYCNHGKASTDYYPTPKASHYDPDELGDFLETEDYPQYLEMEFTPESEGYEAEEASSSPYQPCPQILSVKPQNDAYSIFVEQELQKQRNEEIAKLLSPIRKSKENIPTSAWKTSKNSQSKIRRKFSLLNGPCESKKSPSKPPRFNNSMKEWHDKVIPIIKKISKKPL